MIKIRIKKSMKEAMLQEAMRVEAMGLPDLIVTFIKEDIPRNREAQVRLGTILKNTILPPILVDALGSKFGNWQNFLQAEFEKTDESTDSEEEITNLIDRTTTLFQFQFKDITAARKYQQNSGGYEVYPEKDTKPYSLKSLKSSRKALTKNLIKYGWDISTAKKINLFLDGILIRYYDNFIRDDSKGQRLIAFLNEHPDNHNDVADMTWLDASNFAYKYFIEKEDEDNIIKRYPKKDLFWYNIGKGSCSLEASRMGHCGRETDSSTAILYSLRRKTPKMKVSDSHVTISYVEDEKKVYQIKGKNNCVPKESYGPYVVDFLKMMEVEEVEETGQHSSCDFSDFLEYLEEKYPDAEYKDSARVQLERLDEEIGNGEHNTDNVQIYSYVEDYDEVYMDLHANVSFRIPLDFLENDEQVAKMKELFDDESDENHDVIKELCDFEYFDEDADDASFRVHFYKRMGYIQVTFDIRDRYDGLVSTLQQAENQIRTYQNAYTDNDCHNYGEKIVEYLLERYSSIMNPETAEKMEEIRDKMDELMDGYNHFIVYDEGNDVYFQTPGIQLPIKIPYFTRPQGLTMMSDEKKYKQWQSAGLAYADKIQSSNITDDIEKVFINSAKTKHKKAMAAAMRQVSLSAAGMKLPPKPDPKEFNVPAFVEMDTTAPGTKTIFGDMQVSDLNRETVVPVYRIKFALKIEISDDISDVLWGMEYVDYLDKNMDDILTIFEESEEGESLQRAISRLHQQFVRQMSVVVKENKRRRVKIKIN